MPIYAYKCGSCGHAKDVLQKLSDAPLTQCPACGAETFSKQLTAAGFQLKGSGWYATDFRNGSQPPAETKADKPDDATAAKGDATAAKSDATAAKGDAPATPAKPDSGATPAKSEPAPTSTKSDAPSASAGGSGAPSASH